MNQVVLVGRLTDDPTFDMHMTKSGEERPFVRFRLAVNRRFVRRNDPGQTADFFNVHYWGNGAAAIVEYLYKGKEVAVAGDIRIDEKRLDDGTYSRYVFVNADQVTLLGGPKRSTESVEAFVPNEYGSYGATDV